MSLNDVGKLYGVVLWKCSCSCEITRL